MSGWQVVWVVVIAVVVVAYLAVAIWLLRDLFQDPSATTLAKVLWVLAFVFAPVVSVLVFLIMRWPAMSLRRAEQQGRGRHRHRRPATGTNR